MWCHKWTVKMLVPERCVKLPSGHEIHAVTWSHSQVWFWKSSRIQKLPCLEHLGRVLGTQLVLVHPCIFRTKPKMSWIKIQNSRLEEQMGSGWVLEGRWDLSGRCLDWVQEDDCVLAEVQRVTLLHGKKTSLHSYKPERSLYAQRRQAKNHRLSSLVLAREISRAEKLFLFMVFPTCSVRLIWNVATEKFFGSVWSKAVIWKLG